MNIRLRAALACVLLFASCVTLGAAPPAQMDTRAAPTEEDFPRVHSPDPVWLGSLPQAQTIQLSQPSTFELLKRAASPDQRRSVAYGRSVESAAANVVALPGETAIKVLINSKSAIHLRVAVSFRDDAQYRLTAYRPGDELHAVSLYRKPALTPDPLLTVWTPITDGETQVVVVERLGETSGEWSVELPLISHFDRPLFQTRGVSPDNFGDSQPCQVDIICVYQLAPASMQPTLLIASRAVALMSFTKSDGYSYWCTGSLLNTASYPSPIFLTAFHCLSDTQSLASLTTFWFYSRTTCESGPPSATTTQVAGGAVGIFGNAALDAALVVLNQMPPAQASYTGWDASTMQSGTTILAIHHPSGDVKKASFGIELGTNLNAVLFDIGTFPAGSFYVVSWELGIVEHGSSGSGLLSFNQNTGYFYLRGTLTGGDATCSSNRATTYYSRLDKLYPYIQTALNQPLPPPVTTTVAVEYYYAAWNFYFETSFTDEIAALDGGAFGGAWKRTGQTFKVWPQSNTSASPTCRFFSTAFAPKSSHFYTPFASECAIVKTNAAWQYEAIAFYIQLANANGLCSGGTIPLYRLYNNGMGGAPNHRYTTSVTIFNQMVAAGWIFEGNGNTKVFACVPQ